MRSLLKNQQIVYYKRYLGSHEIIDEFGNSTGSYEPIYDVLESAMLCVSPNKGTSEAEMFGSLEAYDRTMTTADIRCPIDEDTILWIDGVDTNAAHNYIVKRRAPWKNSVSFAIQKVDVSHG